MTAMTQIFKIHPVNPQRRLLERAAALLREGGVIVYPTDSTYALGCQLADKEALDRIRGLRRTDVNHEFSLVCRDLSQIAGYARVDNQAYRLIRSLTPGPYTFILKATHEAPRRLRDPKKKSVGIRVPDNKILSDLLDVVGEPIVSSTLHLPGDELPLTDPDEFKERLEKQVDAIIDGGACGVEPTTVLDLTDGDVRLVRQGKGDASSILS
jgi:tRNA threonylcarbamoyl adenosine modification protein (Sua5/YciO/YrdC/YwlC family)